MSPAIALLLTAVLLALNAYFVATEFSLTGSRRSRLEPLVGQRPSASRVLWAIEHLSQMLAAAQLGVTLCSVGLGVLAEPAIARLLAAPLAAAGLNQAVVHAIAFLLALVIVVALHVVIGEMVPKSMSVTHPEKSALLLVPPLMIFEKIFYPVILLLNWLSLGILRLLGIEPKDEVASAFTAEEVASIVEASEAAGVLHDDHGLITGALEFSEHDVADVMIPIDAVAGVTANATPADVEAAVAATGYSRFLVRDSSGKVSGYLHMKDLLGASPAARHEPIPAWKVRTLVKVAPDEEVETALKVMRGSGSHLASVVAHGDVVGIVFLEDILEELIGDIRDRMQRG
jgi:CBS domain containing-hemolysin-like protein